jgi:hypothetical protein
MAGTSPNKEFINLPRKILAAVGINPTAAMHDAELQTIHTEIITV